MARKEMQFIAVTQLSELEEEKGMCFEIEGQKIALFRTEDDEIYAIGDVCPHQGAPLSDGWFESEDCIVTCPLHAWDFDIRTGQRTNGPESVQSYKVRIVDDTVQVAL